MPQKTSSSFWLRVSLILGSLAMFFVAIPAVSAHKLDYISSSQALVNAEQETPTKVPSAMPPASQEKRKKTTAADLPTKRYGFEIEIDKISVKLDPLAAADLKPATPNQIGKGRTIDILSADHGRLIENDDGTKIRTFAITSPGSLSIRVHFEGFDIPEGDEVYVYGSSVDSHIAGPYIRKGPFKDGEFWADSVEGDTAIIEYYIRGEERGLRIPEISHFFGNVQGDLKPSVLECHNDASCFPTLENNSVGRIVFMRNGEAEHCTGTMLVDRNQYLPSLFLTANHCVDSEQIARTVEVYWFYQSVSCGNKQLRSDLDRTQTGATLIARNEPMDSALIRFLYEVPGNLFYSGWDPRIKPLGTSVFGLHHPDRMDPADREDPNSIISRLRRSFGQITSLTGSCEKTVAGYTTTWSSGVTEGGSSGSGLWATENNLNYLIGILSCGPNATCGAVNNTKYGKFSDFYRIIQPIISAPPCSQTPIAMGQTITGQLTALDCQARRGTARRYTFNASAGQQVHISVESADFDTYLSLLGPNQALVAYNDDSGGAYNSKIPETGVLSLSSSGIYTIEVSSFSGNSVGSFTLKLNVAQVNPSIELSIDDGIFEDALGLAIGGTGYTVNRITPSSYPATLSDVAIFFRNEPNEGVRVGDSLTIVAGANPSGSLNIDNIALQRSPSTVRDLGKFNLYNISDITIFSGDFVIGFVMTYPAGVFPTALDQSPPSRRRSYFSTNGTNFIIIDDLAANLAGNFGIRGRAVQGAAPCTYNLFPTSQSFNSSVGNGIINVTTASNCPWTATSNSGWIGITSGASGVGNGTVFFSVSANTGIARSGAISVAGQTFFITQAAGGPTVLSVEIAGKKLLVYGLGFAFGAEILIDGIRQKKVSNDEVSPTTLLIAKKAGQNIARGQTIIVQVRNPDGTTSPPTTWIRL